MEIEIKKEFEINNIDVEEKSNKPSFVYLLVSTDNCTYVGATIDLERRLRQHNKEIKGGAFQTSKKVIKGEIWLRAAYVSGFPDWTAALQFEWRWKQISRKLIKNYKNPLERRMKALKELISLGQSTTKALPYDKWSLKPEIHFELEEAENIYKNLE